MQNLKFIIIIGPLLFWFESSHALENDCDLAQNYFWQGQLGATEENSLQHYIKSINLCPGFIRPYELTGNIHRKNQKYDEAIDYFTKAANLGSKNYKLYYWLAYLLFEKNDYDRSKRYIDKCLKLKGDYNTALILRDRILQKKDEKGPIIDLFEPSPSKRNVLPYEYEIITVRGVATDKSGLKQVSVNSIPAQTDTDGRFLADIPIRVGKNNINVVAEDLSGNFSELEIVIIRESYVKGVARKNYNSSIAVVVGIDKYEEAPRLDFAVADALALESELSQTGFDDVVTILDGQATQRRLLTELFSELPQKATLEDRVIFYFAGHGMTYQNPDGTETGYIIPVDSDMKDYQYTAISMDQIRNLVSYIPAKHIFFIFDSCYSGHILDKGSEEKTVNSNKQAISSKRVVQIMTAGTKNQRAMELEGHGLFTKILLDGLSGQADSNDNKIVTGFELGAFVPPQVSRISKSQQTPLYSRIEGQGEVMFFLDN